MKEGAFSLTQLFLRAAHYGFDLHFVSVVVFLTFIFQVDFFFDD